ncbi:MAG: SCO family protein [Bryobacteraceae bacterium]|jgi:cytochrome oxidase Cu insertion factor (SCO1/SenC/PrrC family)
MHRRLWLTICLAAAGCTLRSSLPELGDVPAFTLTAQDGTAVSRDSLKGKVWVVDFIFTSCHGPCPRLSAQMHRLQSRLLANGRVPDDVRLISITVDPTHDTPAVLAGYARNFQADAHLWRFLTGPEGSIAALTADAFHVNTAANLLEHSTKFVLVDRKARIRGYYESTDASTLDQLIEDIGPLRKEIF